MAAGGWSVDEMYALGTLHARLEAEQKLDELMDTLVAEPVYEFHPMGMRMEGGETTRRYYAQFFADFMSKIAGYVLIDEWVNEDAVVQEYDITVTLDGEQETHRVVGILYREGRLLGGERIYGSERLVRLFCGEMFDALVPIEAG
jgi:hypothetical protein